MRTLFKTLSVIGLSAALALLFTSCKKDQEPAPEMGTLLTYTNISKSEFDRIDVIVDGKVVAALTEPYKTKPICGAESSASVVVIALSPGTHKVYAVQYKNGKNVGEWGEENENILPNKCTPINWTE